MNYDKRVLMIAAENDALRGAKVGGVADVLRDIPAALTGIGTSVDVIIPSYGFLARLPDIEICTEFNVFFGGVNSRVQLFKVPSESGVSNYILHHPAFAPQGEVVYCNDEHQPFATDATKFAFFCLAVAEALRLGAIARPDVIHCHDWHSAFLLILLRFAPEYKSFDEIRTVYTIHNLAMQGVRPFKNDPSSLEAWYPQLYYDGLQICDTHNPFCVNPMRAAIRLADRVHTVSPTYAEEILRPSNHPLGIYGGEGLEGDLQQRSDAGELIGIINGCEYPKGVRYAAPAKKKLVSVAQESLVQWASRSPVLASAHFVASKRLQQWAAKKTRGFNVTFVGRLTEQKAALLVTRLPSGKLALEEMLDALGDRGQFIMLGSGSSYLEEAMLKLSGDYENFIFLNGFSAELSLNIYRYGDLFLMPSSFEPCGISQMLAMRAGQPCLVNGVGGLRDTVDHQKTGFCFNGENAQAQAQAMLIEFCRILSVHESDPKSVKDVGAAAAEVRFDWQAVAERYVNELYRI
ncbi:glycogen synthase [Teredinibacter turnerae]|uniref:glycogen synthase n=1 Tax=Teredinibacter turnerae TaxID=2426 RepID=UPI001F0847E4|nr:glycogen/starch synthase [Teredinibacter turnerae]